MTIGKISVVLLSLFWLFVGCTTVDNGGAKKPAPSGLISTPVSYYSTAKAKYLATKYKENLDRIIEQVVRNPKTAPLQFANNIASVGGIGFFTHSATKTADERYLELVLATPETFETKGDYSEKVQRLFSLYGFDLLRILNGDGELYQDGELTGYGLNLAWRNVVADPTGNRVILARAIIYLPKEKVRTYLRSEIKQNELLADAIIFGEEEDRPLTLVSYRPQDTRPDVRPAIREDNLTVTAESEPSLASPAANEKLLPGPTNQPIETAKADGPGLAEMTFAVGEEFIKQEPEVNVALEPLKNERSTSSELASHVDEDKSPSSTTSVSSGSKERAQANRPATELRTEAKASIPNTPDNKIETKQASSNTRVKAPDSAMKKLDDATVVKSSVLPEPTAMARIEEPQRKLSQNLEPPVVAQPTEPSPVEKSKTPVVESPTAQVKTSKIIHEPKETPAEPINVIPAKNNSIPRATETETTSLPQAITKSESPPETSAHETKSVNKPATQVLATSKNEGVTAKIELSNAVAEKTASIPEAAKAPIEPSNRKPEPNITTATEVKKGLDVTGRESVSNTAAKSSSQKLSTDNADKTTVPVVTAKTMIEKPVVPEKRTVSSPSVQSEPVTVAKGPPREGPIALSPRLDPAQNTVPRTIVREQKQADRGVEIEMPTGKPSEVSPSSQSKSATPAVAAPEPSREQAPEQLALLRKPADVIVETKPPTRAVKPLEGFVIQIAFNDKDKAQHWAESMKQRGYAVSITESGTEGALRVRLGSFVVRDDAERQLRSFKQEGMNGIIINLPQAFQPARSSVP